MSPATNTPARRPPCLELHHFGYTQPTTQHHLRNIGHDRRNRRSRCSETVGHDKPKRPVTITEIRTMALDTFRSLRNAGQPVFYFDRPLPGGFAHWAEQFEGLAADVKAVLSPAAALAMGVAIGSADGHSFPLFYSVATLGECLSKQQDAALWLLDLPSELEHGSLDVHGVR